MPINSFGQEIGMPLPHYPSGERPSLETIQGHTVRLEKLSLHHADNLYQFYGPSAKKADWTYLPLEPFEDRATFQDYFQTLLDSTDPYYFAIIDQATNQAVEPLPTVWALPTKAPSVRLWFIRDATEIPPGFLY
ncbi:TPA: hypothetical protein ACHVIH_001429 [Streptococcus suis]|uniref:hypothetical protein n=1 Tax=Streptococcus suis TaxID=1307 RepID=UPI0007697F50|nr:hypothetical protein [Streptococcus suis]MDE1695866.1 hypothetical protein [Streptococcus suis]MEE3813750.1 hypothetical protein [Streptococcus suis]CYW05564.1 N-acetyltransferase GCN5 [Streptococcus suis]CYX36818.1 N-acetyltransferase GCN5 [Streptococcus suis]